MYTKLTSGHRPYIITFYLHNVQYSTEAVCYSCSVIYLEFRFDCVVCAALDSVPWLFLQLRNLVQCFCFFLLYSVSVCCMIFFNFVYLFVMPHHQFCIFHIQRKDAFYRSRKSDKKIQN